MGNNVVQIAITERDGQSAVRDAFEVYSIRLVRTIDLRITSKVGEAEFGDPFVLTRNGEVVLKTAETEFFAGSTLAIFLDATCLAQQLHDRPGWSGVDFRHRAGEFRRGLRGIDERFALEKNGFWWVIAEQIGHDSLL
jgi:hypothetical protein